MIVLDTHALIWWVSGEQGQLSAEADAVIASEHARGKILVSSITAWEVAMLVHRGRLALAMDVSAWLGVVEEIEAVAFVPVDNDLAVKAVELPGAFHKDPADRLIVATARKLAVPLVTADDKIRSYPHVRTIW